MQHDGGHLPEQLDDVLRVEADRDGLAVVLGVRTGNCCVNASMESWFSTFKAELGETFDSIRRGKDLAFDYIEVFYNQRRRHSSIGNIAPVERERRYYAALATQTAMAA